MEFEENKPAKYNISTDESNMAFTSISTVVENELFLEELNKKDKEKWHHSWETHISDCGIHS